MRCNIRGRRLPEQVLRDFGVRALKLCVDVLLGWARALKLRLVVFIGGLYLHNCTFSLCGAVVSFSTAPPTTVSNGIEFVSLT